MIEISFFCNENFQIDRKVFWQMMMTISNEKKNYFNIENYEAISSSKILKIFFWWKNFRNFWFLTIFFFCWNWRIKQWIFAIFSVKKIYSKIFSKWKIIFIINNSSNLRRKLLQFAHTHTLENIFGKIYSKILIIRTSNNNINEAMFFNGQKLICHFFCYRYTIFVLFFFVENFQLKNIDWLIDNRFPFWIMFVFLYEKGWEESNFPYDYCSLWSLS